MADTQFEMKRAQNISFTGNEAKLINEALEIIRRNGGNKTPNSFIKKETIARADKVLKGDN